jgi:hypothetical protein
VPFPPSPPTPLFPPCTSGETQLHLVHDAQISSGGAVLARRLGERRLQDAESAFRLAMSDGLRRLVRLNEEEMSRMVRLWYIFGGAFTISVLSVPPYLAGQLINGNGTDICDAFRLQRLARIDVADSTDTELRVIQCPPLPAYSPWCSLRWLLIALLVVSILVLCASCCCGIWMFIDVREGRVGSRRAPKTYVPPDPNQRTSLNAGRVVRTSDARSSAASQPGGVVATMPARRSSRPGKIDPIAEHLENADEDMQDLQAIKLSMRASVDGRADYDLPYSTPGEDRRSYQRSVDMSIVSREAYETERRYRGQQLLMLAVAFICLFVLALLALIFSASGVALSFDPETVCRTPW